MCSYIMQLVRTTKKKASTYGFTAGYPSGPGRGALAGLHAPLERVIWGTGQ